MSLSSSLMASSSSCLTPFNYKFDVFASFHGPDVRKTLLSHMREQFNHNGITMFNDEEIVRSATIGPSLTDAIRESRISIVILSKKYASSSWCLDELVEILKCKETMGQIVMTVFYGVDPSDVRKQTGEFGIAFNDTCERKMDESMHEWSKALTYVSNIAGEDFLRWDNEAKMIKKIAKDVSNKLNATPSRDFDGMVGIEAHLRKMESLLDLDNGGVKMVGITGPAGIGKTTIARALESRISSKFQLTCFMDNLRGNYHSGTDELRLQEQFLSKVLNQDGITISHSGVIEERLCKQRVLIILDDVNHIRQLEALANTTTWFGHGSRIVVTTENKELLQQHDINDIYRVDFPSREEAITILRRYAFRESHPHDGFEEVAERITQLCGKLPLGLRVVGSSLRGRKDDEWEDVMKRLETIVDRDIEDVIRVGYESLDEDEQTLFLHIGVFFNYEDNTTVKDMFIDHKLSVKRGLKILVNRSLIDMNGEIIKMHILLRQMARQAIRKQEPWKRKILMDAHEICEVLENKTGTRVVSGISFNISNIDQVSINRKAFRRMPNLRFLKVYKSRFDGNDIVHISMEEMEFPHRLKLLDWEAYPSKSLPFTLHLGCLVELKMVNSNLEYLWKGIQVGVKLLKYMNLDFNFSLFISYDILLLYIQPLPNLKKMVLRGSSNLKELPDLSKATNLKSINLIDCKSLEEIPVSFSHLLKLENLNVGGCINLQVIPAHINLASLGVVWMNGCSRLKSIPLMSRNNRRLYVTSTSAEEVSESIRLCSHLEFLNIRYSRKLKGITNFPTSVKYLVLSCCDIKRIPDCIKDLKQLLCLDLTGCKRLESLPELPRSLRILEARDCESLETVFLPFKSPFGRLKFNNCIKLSQQARRAVIQQSCFLEHAILPGKEVPPRFNHRGRGNSLIIRPYGNPYNRFVVCLVFPTLNGFPLDFNLRISIVEDGFHPFEVCAYINKDHRSLTEHLLIFDATFLNNHLSDMSKEVKLEFSCDTVEVNECGAKFLTVNEFDDSEGDDEHTNEVICESSIEGDVETQTHCWSWLFLPLLRFCENLRKLGFGKNSIES